MLAQLNKSLLLLFVLSTVALCGCEEEDDSGTIIPTVAPPYANEVTAVINGETFTATQVITEETSSSIMIIARANTTTPGSQQKITLTIPLDASIGQSGLQNVRYQAEYKEGNFSAKAEQISTNRIGVNDHFELSKIIMGHFEFSVTLAPGTANEKKVDIAFGEFDVKY